MKEFLRSMEYPCTKDDLLREAQRSGLPAALVARLNQLEDRPFHGSLNVLDGHGERDEHQF